MRSVFTAATPAIVAIVIGGNVAMVSSQTLALSPIPNHRISRLK